MSAAAPKPATTSHAPAGKVRRARVEWDPAWPRFRWWEYVGTAVVYGLDWYVRYHLPPPEHALWQGDNPFDDTIRGWLRADTLSGRHTAVRFSDYVSLAGTFYPFAVDLPVVLLVHRQPGVMWQMLMMNLEANAVAGLVNNTLFHACSGPRATRTRRTATPTAATIRCAAASGTTPASRAVTR